jgi:hypothetical protein
MKIIKLIGTSVLTLLFGVAVPALAQEPQDQPKDQPREKPKEQPKEKPKEQPKEQPRSQQEPKNPKDNKDNRGDAAHRDEHAKADAGHNGEQGRNGEHGAQGHGRIPDDKFRAHFGREHTFHVGHPEVVGGQPHFSYGGYSFIIAQPWPAGWGYDDDVYIIDVDGVYYLVDLAHPGVQLTLNIIS